MSKSLIVMMGVVLALVLAGCTAGEPPLSRTALTSKVSVLEADVAAMQRDAVLVAERVAAMESVSRDVEYIRDHVSWLWDRSRLEEAETSTVECGQ